MLLRVVPVQCLRDNYAYILVDIKSKLCAVVDPVEPDKVLKNLDTGLELKAVLTTHHHSDHSGGNAEMARRFPQVPIYGGDERIPALTHRLKHNDKFDLGSTQITALETPCHTSGHISYHASNGSASVLFSGDTLFVGGCGRFFEGTAKQMEHSLLDIIGQLSSDTLIYPGHEYTLSNMHFAQHVDPHNEHVKNKVDFARDNTITVTSRLAEEFLYNPFMRVRQPMFQEQQGQNNATLLMQQLRDKKNSFRH